MKGRRQKALQSSIQQIRIIAIIFQISVHTLDQTYNQFLIFWIINDLFTK